jgi:tetratricopeptide (TPR) repeat protein
MKLIISSLFIIGIFIATYYFSLRIIKQGKKHKGVNKKALAVSITVAVIFIVLQFLVIYWGAHAPDTQCTTTHTVTYTPPKQLNSAMDYFIQGNYNYDIGNCDKAITDYSTSIHLNTNYPQAYNNRGYTFMRMQNYEKALPDLNKAIELKPNYIQALMNRGDLYNYYGPTIDKQKAITDYNKVISLGGGKETSVCGHLFLAKHNGWNLGTVLDIPRVILNPCKD